MSQSKWQEEEFNRGQAAGSKEQSAAEMGAHIIAAPFLSKEYLAGHEKGQADRAKGKA